MLAEKKSIAFLAKFFAIFGAGELLLPVIPLDWLEQSIAGLEAKMLGIKATGNIVSVQNYEFLINEYCTGAVSSLILFALVFSLKKPGIKTKAGMWAVGTSVLFIANIGRVYAVLWSAANISPGIAESVHIASWFLVSGIIIALWYYLTKNIAKVENFRELL